MLAKYIIIVLNFSKKPAICAKRERFCMVYYLIYTKLKMLLLILEKNLTAFCNWIFRSILKLFLDEKYDSFTSLQRNTTITCTYIIIGVIDTNI